MKLPRKLSPAEGLRLRGLCEDHQRSTIPDHPPELDEFAIAALQKQTLSDNTLAEGTERNPGRHLRRIIDGIRPLSYPKLASYAMVLGCSAEELLSRISDSDGNIFVPKMLIPWITDEAVVSKYRAVYHHYHLARRDDDEYFWIYTPIDFQTPQNGFLHASIKYRLEVDRHYSAYGYLFDKMLVLVFKREDLHGELELVHMYYKFREDPFGKAGNFGFVQNENINNTKGISASLLFAEPFPCTAAAGCQEDTNLCARLTEYWRIMDGPRCNRLLQIFGSARYKRPSDYLSKLETIRTQVG